MRGIVCVAVLLLFVCLVSCDNKPLSIITTLTGVESEIMVSFRTTAQPKAPAVRYWISGKESAAKDFTIASSSVHSWTRPRSKATPEFISMAAITSLTLGVTYVYKVTDDVSAASPTWSAEYSFKTLASDTASYNVAVYGDLGAYGHSIRATSTYPGSMTHYASAGKFDYVMHFGDLAYNMQSYNSDKTSRADDLFQNMSPILQVAPYVAGVGNHEFNYKSGQDYNNMYYSNLLVGQTRMGTRSKSTKPLEHFSYDKGPVHFVMINTEVVCEKDAFASIEAQYNFVAADLKAASEAGAKWIVVMGHRWWHLGYSQKVDSQALREGVYCPKGVCQLKACPTTAASADCKYGLGKLFTQYKVSVVFMGHAHQYSRNAPIAYNLLWEVHTNKNAYLNPQYPAYILSGAAGTQGQASQKKRYVEEEDAEVTGVYNVSAADLIHNHEHFTAEEAKGLREVSAAMTTYKTGSPLIINIHDVECWTLMSVSNTKLSFETISIKDNKVIDSFYIQKGGSGKAASLKTLAPKMAKIKSTDVCSQ